MKKKKRFYFRSWRSERSYQMIFFFFWSWRIERSKKNEKKKNSLDHDMVTVVEDVV